MSLSLALNLGDEIRIGEAVVKLEYRSGQRVGLKIDAPREVDVRLSKEGEKPGKVDAAKPGIRQ